MPIASALSRMPGPSAVTIASASRIAGIAKTTSLRRRITADTGPPRYPATIPATEPITPAISVARQAISSETPMPESTSEKRSRPNWSVPNGCDQVRPLRLAFASCACGSCGRRPVQPRIAPTTTSATSTSPMRPLRLDQSVRRRCGAVSAGRRVSMGSGPGPKASSCSASTVVIASPPRPRVDQRRRDVDQHVHHDEAGREEHRQALHDREVAVVDRRHEQASEAGQDVDLLDDDGTAEQVAELDTRHRHDGHERVQEDVLPDDGAAGEPFPARGADEVLAAHLEHRGARRAHDRRADAEAQHERREEDLLHVQPRVAEEAHVAVRRGEVLELRGEERDEAGAEHEAGDAEPDDRHALPDVVGGFARAEAAEDAEADADQDP